MNEKGVAPIRISGPRYGVICMFVVCVAAAVERVAPAVIPSIPPIMPIIPDSSMNIQSPNHVHQSRLATT